MTVFVDSATLIYPLDLIEQDKAKTCELWLKSLRDSGTLVLATQVLNETFWVISRKSRFTPARLYIRDYVRSYHVYCSTPVRTSSHQDHAWALQDQHGVAWCDALLLASANVAGCTYFLSEDLNDGQIYGSVQVVNPFRHLPKDVLDRGLPD